MVDEAAKAKVSAVKFQFHVLEDEMLKKNSKNQVILEKVYIRH